MRNYYSKSFAILFALLFFDLTVCAQKSFALKDYFLNDVGDEWQYKNLAPDGLSPIITKVAATENFGGKTVLRRTENNGDYRLQTLDAKGLTVYRLYFVGDRFIEYDAPILLMPARLQLGETHKSAAKYKTTVGGETKETGTQTYETVAEKIEDADTPLGRFKNCLVVRTVALRVDASGSQKGYELVEWHAKGVGAVKVAGELFWKNKAGDVTRRFKINAELEKATIRGKSVKAK